MAGSQPVAPEAAARTRHRTPRWPRRLLAVGVAILVLWGAVTVGWAVADTVALGGRADELQTAWSADPARLAAARAGEPFRAPNVGGRWQWGGNTQTSTAEVTADGLVAWVVAGSCDPYPWSVVPRWTDDLLVLDARPDVPVLPDATLLSRWGPHGCDSAAHGVAVVVPLDRALDGRIVVDAWSGVALIPRQSR